MPQTVKQCEYFTLGPGRERQLAQKVCRVMILQTWRQARVQQDLLQKKEKELKKDVQNLILQVGVLKHLQASEKERTLTSMKDVDDLKVQLEENEKQISDLRKDVLKLDSEKLEWERTEKALSQKVHSLNDKANCKQQSIDILTENHAQLERSISELKRTNGQIAKTLEETEHNVTDKTLQMKSFKLKCLENQEKINKLTGFSKELTFKIKLKKMKIVKCVLDARNIKMKVNNLKLISEEQNRNISELKEEVASRTSQIDEYENLIRKLKQAKRSLEEENTLKYRLGKVVINVAKCLLNLLPTPHI